MTSEEAINSLEHFKCFCYGHHLKACDLAIAALKDNWTVEKRKERAEWAKAHCWNYSPVVGSMESAMPKKLIDEAFELEEPTLDEKLGEEVDITSIQIMQAIKICREHFKNNPKELEEK